jgi:hypothetical protein
VHGFQYRLSESHVFLALANLASTHQMEAHLEDLCYKIEGCDSQTHLDLWGMHRTTDFGSGLPWCRPNPCECT